VWQVEILSVQTTDPSFVCLFVCKHACVCVGVHLQACVLKYLSQFVLYIYLFIFQSQVVEFVWPSIKEWEVDDEAMAFCFQYQRPERNPRWVKIFTPYVSLFSHGQNLYSYIYEYFLTTVEGQMHVDICSTL
jgi:hypothetical protein